MRQGEELGVLHLRSDKLRCHDTLAIHMDSDIQTFQQATLHRHTHSHKHIGYLRNLLDVEVEVTVVILTHYYDHQFITTAEGRGSEGGCPVGRGGSIDYYVYEG